MSIRALIKIIRMPEYLLCFFKTDAALRITPKSDALILVKL